MTSFMSELEKGKAQGEEGNTCNQEDILRVLENSDVVPGRVYIQDVNRRDIAGRRQDASHSWRALTKPELGLMQARLCLTKPWAASNVIP